MQRRANRVVLRAATEQDIGFLLSLRQVTMGPHFEASGIVQDEQSTLDRVLDEFGSATIIENEGSPIGLFKAVRRGQPWKLLQVQLLPEWQGQGVGTGLIKDLLSQAAHARAQVELHVLKVNVARRLYKRLGFKVIGEGPSAFIMRTEA